MDTLGYLADVTVRSFCLATAALACVWAFRLKSAASRHAVMTLVTAGMLTLAVLASALPRLPLPVLHAKPQQEAVPAAIQIQALPSQTEPVISSTQRTAPANLPQLRLRIVWPMAAAALYYTIAVALLLRLSFGVLLACRMVAASKSEGDIYESTWITVPVTVGWLRPKILLPYGWKEWKPEKLAVVLAHDRTHVQRADWAIGILAGLNRSVFWFNPLAWWLERRMAHLAEEACDDATVRATGAREAYAEALLDMAAAVRNGRGQRLWEAMAMARTAEVRNRIERILDDAREIPRGLTRARWTALVACGLPVLYMAAVVEPVSARSGAAIQISSAHSAAIAQTQPAAPSPGQQPANPPISDHGYIALFFEIGMITPSEVPKYFAAFQDMVVGRPQMRSTSGNNFMQSLVNASGGATLRHMRG